MTEGDDRKVERKKYCLGRFYRKKRWGREDEAMKGNGRGGEGKKGIEIFM